VEGLKGQRGILAITKNGHWKMVNDGYDREFERLVLEDERR
jgi:hypothetical protein